MHSEICKCIILINLKLVNLIEQKMKIKEREGKEKLLVWRRDGWIGRAFLRKEWLWGAEICADSPILLVLHFLCHDYGNWRGECILYLHDWKMRGGAKDYTFPIFLNFLSSELKIKKNKKIVLTKKFLIYL